MRTTRFASIVMAIIAAGLVAVGCSSSPAPGSDAASVAPPSIAASAAPAAATQAASPSLRTIEDSGVETTLAAGTYASRLFEPALTLQLDEGWYRRDPNDARHLNLRRSQDLSEDVTFISGIDYVQCGTAKPVKSPDSAAIVAGLTASPMLKVSAPVEVSFGERTGTAITLSGGGDPVPEADFGRSNEFGCILSQGDPFPAESFWLMATRDAQMHLVLLDVDGTTVVVRTRPGDTTADVDALYDQTLQLLTASRIG